jgi:hypothetical protein
MKSLEFKALISVPALFFRRTVEREIVMGTFYVDDALAVENTRKGDTFTHDVKARFKLKEKDLRGGGQIILGMLMQWDDSKGRMKLSVPFKVDNLAKELGMEKANTAQVPMLRGAIKQIEDCTKTADSKFPYAKAIGTLLWIANVARPDITFTVNRLSRHLMSPNEAAVNAVKHLVRYLLGTKDLGIVYQRQVGSGFPEITAYSDSDWAGDHKDFKSTTGFIIMLNGGPISWKSRKQTVQAKSSAEAEYVAASACASEVLWFRNIYLELHQGIIATPTTIYVDNNSAISMTENDVDQSRARSIGIQVHHVKEHVQLGNIRFTRVNGADNPADIFTKPLEPAHHRKCVQLLGLA